MTFGLKAILLAIEAKAILDQVNVDTIEAYYCLFFMLTPNLDNALTLASPIDITHLDKPSAKELQTLLNAAGFNCGDADGIVGHKTRDAFANFKRSRHLNQVTLISATTLQILKAAKVVPMTSGKRATKVNQAGLDLIKEFEGCSLVAYLCPAGVPTIGYGSTHGLTRADVAVKKRISKADAEALLIEDLQRYEAAVERLVTVALNESEYAALVSLCYNIGIGAFGRSSVLKRLNRGDRQGAADAFLMWNRAGKRVLDGLTRRRHAERKLFLS